MKQYSTRAEAVKASKGRGTHKMPNGKFMVGKSHPKKKSVKKPRGKSY